MKYLQDYIQEAQSNCFKQYGVFFAFSGKQFEEQKDPDIPTSDYVHTGMGMYLPEKNAKKCLEKLSHIVMDGVKQDMKENGKENIIRRELYNHEAFYTGDIESTLEALELYPITKDEVRKVFDDEQNKSDADAE